MEAVLSYLQSLAPGVWIAIALAMLAGGFVKGVHGMGLPLVSVPILSSALPVQTAIAVTLLPILLTNFYQIRVGRDALPIVRRFALLVGLVVGILIGVYALTNLAPDLVTAILGAVILGFVAIRIRAPDWRLTARGERLGALPVGLTAGLVGGITSIYGTPIAIYLSALGLDRQTFVRAIGITFMTGIIPLYSALAAFDILGLRETALSLIALVPVFVGYLIGERTRGRISETAFQRGFTLLLAAIGLTLLYRGLGALL